MKISTTLTCLAGMALTATVGIAPAEAKLEFPREVAQDLGAPVAPACGLCHQDGKTGNDTLVTPFAWAMRARGMTGGSSLNEALDRMKTDAVDSDGDLVIDVDEIVAGTDPNSAASTPPTSHEPSDPQLGCALAGDAGRPTIGAGWLFAAGVMWAVRRGRPRRRPPSVAAGNAQDLPARTARRQ